MNYCKWFFFFLEKDSLVWMIRNENDAIGKFRWEKRSKKIWMAYFFGKVRITSEMKNENLIILKFIAPSNIHFHYILNHDYYTRDLCRSHYI